MNSRGIRCDFYFFGFHGCGGCGGGRRGDGCCRSRCIRTAYSHRRTLGPRAARKKISLLANGIKKFDQRIECFNHRQKIIRHTVKRIAIVVVNLADPIKPTPHFFKLLPLSQVSSPVDERYQNKKFENHELVFAKKKKKIAGRGPKRLHCQKK